MAKKNVVIFDGEDKFINPKKAVYSKSKGQAKKVESFKSLRAALMDEEGTTQSASEAVYDDRAVADDLASYNQTTIGGGTATAIEAPSQYVIPNLPENLVAPPIPILSDDAIPNIPLPSLRDIINPSPSQPSYDVIRNAEYIERPQPIYIAPSPELPSYNYEDDRKTIMPIYEAPPQYVSQPITQEPIESALEQERRNYLIAEANRPDNQRKVNTPIPELPSYNYEDEFRKKTFPIENKPEPISTSTVFDDIVFSPFPKIPAPPAKSPVSGIGLTFGENSGVKKTCPDGMRDYFGTCIPIQNQYAVCQQGYMKEYEGGPCVPIHASGALGGCAAGYEYKMGYRSGSLTPEMGCYPIGSYQDINTGGSTGAILGGGTGSNIGGGGTVQGGGGIYGDLDSTNPYPNKNYNCPEYTVYDPVSGQCRAAYENAVVPCPAGFTLNKATGTCIESLNPQDYKCPPINLPNPPRCKKYAVVGKDTFGCDRYELVDDAANCPDVIQDKPIECQDGLIYSEALKKCVNPIDETKRPPLTTPEGTCPDDYTWNVAQQKCIAKCATGQAWDPVNFICVDATKPKTPYCSANMVWDEAQQKCVFTGTTTKPPVTSQTTTTTTKKPTKDTLGEPPTGDGGAMGGGGGGGSEEAPAAAIAKKNYFWWYVGGAVLAYYVYSKYNKKNN